MPLITVKKTEDIGKRTIIDLNRHAVAVRGLKLVHVEDAAVAEALKGLHRFSPRIVFLGSYPKADGKQTKHEGNNSNAEFETADAWFKNLLR